MKSSILKHRCRDCGDPCFKIVCYRCKKIKAYKYNHDKYIKTFSPSKYAQLRKINKGKTGNFKIINLPKLSKKQYQDLVSSVIEKNLGDDDGFY